MRRISLASLGLVLLGMLAFGAPARAAEDPLGLAVSTPIAASARDVATETTIVTNNTVDARTVNVALQVTQGEAADITVSPSGELSIPGAGLLQLTLSLASGSSLPVAGFIAVADESSGQVVRRAFTFESSPEPQTTTWTSAKNVLPTSTGTSMTALPLESAECAGSSTTLVNEDDAATVTATCTGDALALAVSDLDDWRTGEYKGTLTVGATDVSVTLIRRAPLWLAILTLVLGAALGLLVRGYVSRDPIRRLEKQLTEAKAWSLTPPEAWKDTPAEEWLARAPNQTVASYEPGLTPQALWGWRRRVRWFFAPSSGAATFVEQASAGAKMADAAKSEWNTLSGAVLGGPQPDGPKLLSQRARGIWTGSEAATSEPAEGGVPGAKRVGLEGVKALLNEARALVVVSTLWQETTRLGEALEAAQPVSDSLSLTLEIRRRWASARIECSAITAHLHQSVDARAVLADEWPARVGRLTQEVEALRLVTGSGAWGEGLQDAGGIVPTKPIHFFVPWDLRQLPLLANTGAVLRATARIVGEALVVLLALAVVVVTGLATAYVGKTWGTVQDILFMLIGAAGGILVLTPLITAVDRLGGTSATAATPAGGQDV